MHQARRPTSERNFFKFQLGKVIRIFPTAPLCYELCSRKLLMRLKFKCYFTVSLCEVDFNEILSSETLITFMCTIARDLVDKQNIVLKYKHVKKSVQN